MPAGRRSGQTSPVSDFADRMMIGLADPAGLRDLLAPAADATHDRIRRLLAAQYALPSAVVHDVVDVTVLDTEAQRPLFLPRRHSAVWTTTQPGYARTDVLADGVDLRAPYWLDLTARLAVTVVLEVDPGQVESITVTEIEDVDSLAGFRARFDYLDLDAFLARHRISTVEQLREAFRYLLAEVRLAPAPPFDPADPAHRRRFELRLAVLVRDGGDLVGVVRDARLVRELAGRVLPVRPAPAGVGPEVEVLAPYAPVVVLPTGSLPAGITEAGADSFFRAQDVLAVFVGP
jgi:hypothetical protein